MPKNTKHGPEDSLENDRNAAWTERQTRTPEARRRYEQERLILWLTEELASSIEESGMSRRMIAERLGTSKAHITQVLRGGRNLTLRSVADIAWAAGCRISARREPLREGHFITSPVTVVRPFRTQVHDDRLIQGRPGAVDLMSDLEAVAP